MNNEKSTTKRKRYDEAFKRAAVEHWAGSGKAAKTVTAELGVNAQSLMQWKQRFGPLPGARNAVRTLDAVEAENRRLRREVESLVRQRANPKKNAGHHLSTERERFERVKAMSDDYSINELCAALDISRSGYRAWVKRTPGPRAMANAELLDLIMQAHEQSRQTYGSPRVTRWLHERGHDCGRHRIARLMRGAGLRQRQRRRFRISLTDSDHDLPVAPNRLMGQPPPGKTDAVWVADITYVDTKEGWLYVAGVLDRHSRRCVGWAMDDTLATSLPLAALDMALTQRRPPEGLVHHCQHPPVLPFGQRLRPLAISLRSVRIEECNTPATPTVSASPPPECAPA